MDRDSFTDMIYIKGKESFVIGLLTVVFGIILIIPVVLIFALRLLFKLIFYVRKKVAEERETATLKTTSTNKPPTI